MVQVSRPESITNIQKVVGATGASTVSAMGYGREKKLLESLVRATLKRLHASSDVVLLYLPDNLNST